MSQFKRDTHTYNTQICCIPLMMVLVSHSPDLRLALLTPHVLVHPGAQVHPVRGIISNIILSLYYFLLECISTEKIIYWEEHEQLITNEFVWNGHSVHLCIYYMSDMFDLWNVYLIIKGIIRTLINDNTMSMSNQKEMYLWAIHLCYKKKKVLQLCIFQLEIHTKILWLLIQLLIKNKL